MVSGPAAHEREEAQAGQAERHRFVSLDSWRGIAALVVVALHIEGPGPILGSTFVRNGWLAVDFFFVLSGFVIAAAYARHLAAGMPLGRFMLLRLGRIYPVHFVVLLALVAYEVVLVAGARYGGMPRTGFAGAVHSWEWLWKTALLVQAFYPDPPPAWNAQSWSISVELWLYVAIALVLRAAGLRGIAIAAGAGAVALAFLAAGFSDWRAPFSFAMARGIAGFGFGTALWWLHQRTKAQLVRIGSPVAGVAECLVVLAAFLAIVRFGGGPGFVWVDLAFAGLIFVFAFDRGLLSRLLARRPFAIVGTISYSLYMVQYPIIRRRALLARAFGLETRPAADPAQVETIRGALWKVELLDLAMIAFALVVAWFCWRLVEDPARRWTRRLAQRWGEARREQIAPTF